ncbi:hypothetical protein CNECB9_2610031 [Cupriavidus necator]|uniref:Uncharacterized protein n=1 Tax=Cupriavidus necator TaxID=106590 RepID=A0A1K0JLA4_CUPNE|nr:hypothetical protein CNECB9_2610031 [Cupriavidus necator]
MTDAFLFSKPFTFLACPGMSEVRAGVDALEALPGHLFWLENEDFIRRVHAPDFLEQSRAALEAMMPGGVALIDAMADEIRRNASLLPALQQMDPDTAAPLVLLLGLLRRRARAIAGHSPQRYRAPV